MDQSANLAAHAAENRTQTKAYATRVLLVVSIGLASGGQLVLLNTVRNSLNESLMQALAGILLIAGACLFGLQARESVVTLPRFEFPPQDATASLFMGRNRRLVSWIAAALGLAIFACFLFVQAGENHTVRLLWLASIAALLIAPVRGLRVEWRRIAPEERVYLGLLGVLLAVTLITRVYNLNLLPYNVDGDFADVGLQARALASGQEQRIFAYGWAQVPLLGYSPAWLTMKLFGNGLEGLNASGVIEGMLLIVGVYLLGRDLFHARVGLFAAAVLTISYAHLAASRQSSYIDSVLFILYAIYFLLIGLREGRCGAFILSGLLTALCFQLYYSARLVVFVGAFILLYLYIFRQPWMRNRWRSVLLWATAILITLGPMLVVFANSPEGFITRARFVFILNPDAIQHLQGAYHVDSLFAVLVEQARRTALLFHYYSDTGTQFGFQRPFLDPFLATLFMVGIGYALFHWRRFGDALVLGWLIVGLVLAGFLTLDPPFWTRLMVLLPPTAILAARTLDLLYEELSRSFVSLKRHRQLIVAAIFGMLITTVGIMNWNTYVMVKGTAATEVTRIGRYLASQPPSTRGFLVSERFGYDVRQLRFIAPDRLVANLTPTEAEGNIKRVGSPTLLILTDEQRVTFEKLKLVYPTGTFETHIGNTLDEIAFYLVKFPISEQP